MPVSFDQLRSDTLGETFIDKFLWPIRVADVLISAEQVTPSFAVEQGAVNIRRVVKTVLDATPQASRLVNCPHPAIAGGSPLPRLALRKQPMLARRQGINGVYGKKPLELGTQCFKSGGPVVQFQSVCVERPILGAAKQIELISGQFQRDKRLRAAAD